MGDFYEEKIYQKSETTIKEIQNSGCSYICRSHGDRSIYWSAVFCQT